MIKSKDTLTEKLDQKIINYVLSKNGLPTQNKVRRFQSGQMNRVYNLGEYILKIEGDKYHKHFHGQQEITDKLIKLGAKVPKITDSGECLDKPYLLIKKLTGKILTHLWLDMNEIEREKIIAELAEQLKIFHSLKFDSFSLKACKGKSFPTFNQTFAKVIDFNAVDETKLSKRQKGIVDFLKDFYKNNLHLITGQEQAVFVHNDIHFENLFVEDGSLTGIIDFDRWTKAPVDYELHKTIDFVLGPFRYVEKQLEADFQKPLDQVVRWLKKYYPELFASKNLADRIRLYYIETAIWLIEAFQHGTWTESGPVELEENFHSLYKTNWLEQVFE